MSNIKLKTYSVKELATIYGVCSKTMSKWIKPFATEVGKKQGRYYTVKQVELILKKIGVPREVKHSDIE